MSAAQSRNAIRMRSALRRIGMRGLPSAFEMQTLALCAIVLACVLILWLLGLSMPRASAEQRDVAIIRISRPVADDIARAVDLARDEMPSRVSMAER